MERSGTPLILASMLALLLALWIFNRTEIVPPVNPGSRWGKKLNPSGTVPRGGYKAFYFNRRKPDTTVVRGFANSIAIDYSWDDFHDIPSEDFAAYWVGIVRYGTTTARQITVWQDWSKSRILIDGKVVRSANINHSTVNHTFSPGEHLIEVEFINNWHTTDFRLMMLPILPLLNMDRLVQSGPGSSESPLHRSLADCLGEQCDDEQAIRKFLVRSRTKGADLYFAGVHEPATRGGSVTVELPSTGRPVVLWLGSVEPVDWKVEPSGRVRAVILGSTRKTSRIAYIPAHRVLSVHDWFNQHGDAKGCHCTAGGYFCEHNADLVDVADKIRALSGMTLNRFFTAYKATKVRFEPYDAAFRETVTQQRERDVRDRAQCVAHGNPDFNHMLDRLP